MPLQVLGLYALKKLTYPGGPLLCVFNQQSKRIDRSTSFGKGIPLGIELYSSHVFMKKLEYIHWTPGKSGLMQLAGSVLFFISKDLPYRPR